VQRRFTIHFDDSEGLQGISIHAQRFRILALRIAAQALHLHVFRRFCQVRFPTAEVPAVEERAPTCLTRASARGAAEQKSQLRDVHASEYARLPHDGKRIPARQPRRHVDCGQYSRWLITPRW
jgi:hypothetical protein